MLVVVSLPVTDQDDLVLLERRADGVALITLNRPKANALCLELLGQLSSILDDLRADPPGAVVLWGGRKHFAAGADISEFTQPGIAPKVTEAFAKTGDGLAELPRAVIAAINGFALGGGMELALACDMRLAATDAKLGQPEVLLGIIPGGGGTQRLSRLVGPSRAKDLLLSGRQVGADEALRIGLVDRVVDPDSALEEALTWAAELAKGPVLAHAAMKELVDRGLDVDLGQALAMERNAFAKVFETEDAKIGVESFMTQGAGKATFVGR